MVERGIFTVKDVARFNQLFIKTAQAFHRGLNQQHSGLSGLNLLVLMTVYDTPGITMSELAQVLEISKAQLSRMIGKLECQHLLKRVHNVTNRRVVNVYVTTTGTRLVTESLQEAWTQIMAQLTQLSATEQTEFKTNLVSLDRLVEKAQLLGPTTTDKNK